jgi:hypothetical protein
MRGGKGPRNYSTGKWNTRPQRGESLKGFFFSSISMSLPPQFENPPTQRLTTPAPRDRTALERVVRKPAPTSHFIIPPRTACTITPLDMATWRHRKRTSRCESASPPSHQYHEHNNSRCDSALLLGNPTHLHLPAGCLQTKTPSPTHLPVHFATSDLLLQLVFLPFTPLEESQRTVSGAKNRAGVGAPLLAGLHLRQPSTTSSHFGGA